ncbi:tRNA (guanosine(18)-2'-O)-methyltransferase [Martiniozyma asiatica (nom. inval.)]|nr:tRNA (guanosine(18)-2'-O)-methyltransferase [Martiniozyma asiatica]
MSSVALLAKHLSAEQQREIALDLISKFQESGEYVTTFCELVNSVPALKTDLYPNVLSFSTFLLKSELSDSEYTLLFDLCNTFEKLTNNLMDFIIENLSIFASANPNLFDRQMNHLVPDNKEQDEIDEKQIIVLFNFSEWYFMNNESYSKSYLNTNLDTLLYLYLSHESSDVSRASSKVLRWRMTSICNTLETRESLWSTIYLLLAMKDKSAVSYGFTLWLRYFSYFTTDVLKESNEFQNKLQEEKYWWFLRDGLISLVHEHKKFALTLCQMSVRSLSTSFDIPIMSWDISKEEEYLDAWKRFCTLYEILGIDTAMNQAEAAKSDLIKIFAPESLVPIPFALTIPSVGFKAAMDRVKKFSLQLLFTLPESSLSLFKHDLKFISNVFLPFTLKSSHFNAYTNSDGSYDCPFGDKLRDFVSHIITSLDETDLAQMVQMIFEVLDEHRFTFGISRIYIVWGILNGLEKKNSLVLNINNVDILCRLFEATAEGEILQTTLQTIHLKFLLHLNPKNVTIEDFIIAIGKFVNINGYKIYQDNEEFFLDFVSTNFANNEVNNLLSSNGNNLDVGAVTIILSILLANKMKVEEIVPSILQHSSSDELIIEMANSGFKFDEFWTHDDIVGFVEIMIQKMATGSTELPIDVYTNCNELLKIDSLFSVSFWESIDLRFLFVKIANDLMLFENVESIRYAISQYKFVTFCFQKCIFNPTFDIQIDELVHLFRNVMKNAPKRDSNVYKYKDEVIAYILNNVTQLFKITEFTPEFKKQAMELSSDVVSMSEYNSHFANVALMTSFIRDDNSTGLTLSDAKLIVESLAGIWQDLIKDRLILNQRDLHQNFIKLLVDFELLKHSANDSELAERIYQITDDVIDQSVGRKALLPSLFKGIFDFKVSQPETFDTVLWLSKLLAKGTLLAQSEQNIFKLDVVLGQDFDKYLNLTGETLYSSVYGKVEMSYRVYIMSTVAAIKCSNFAQEMWKFILENDDIFHLLKPKKRTDLEEQWKRLQLYSIMLLTFEILPKDYAVRSVETVLVPRLFKEASPLCRTYLEWIIALTIHNYPENRDNILSQFAEGVKIQQPMIVTIYERICILIAQKYNKEDESNFLAKFLTDLIIPTATSNRSLNRHFSTSMACAIYQEIENKKLNFPVELVEILKKIWEVATMGEGWTQYRNGDALLWDIKDDLTLVGITGGVLLKTTDRAIDAIYERYYNQFINSQQKELLRYPIGNDESDKWVEAIRINEVRLDTQLENDSDKESSLLQTKSGAWSTVMELDDSSRAASQVKRSQLIVVSSLVDKPPNLGGICRLCDCLGAGWMTMDDMSVMSNPEFKSVAVTADRWMPMLEVKIDEIANFMRLKKKEGYTLIGLEQTDKSVELNSELKFPEKSLILIGKEREGIPGDLLAELDMCVIIKQVGIVRSMNIQTATAVIVHAYSAQHC